MSLRRNAAFGSLANMNILKEAMCPNMNIGNSIHSSMLRTKLGNERIPNPTVFEVFRSCSTMHASASRRTFALSQHLQNKATIVSSPTDGKPVDINEVLKGAKKDIDETIEKWIPRKFDAKSLNRLCGEARYAYDLDSATSSIANPIWEILDRGGKRWRPVLLMLIAEALGGDIATVKDLLVICEVVHNGTLVVDDIEDDSLLRRGKKCLHLMYGIDVSVNVGNAMYYLPTVVLRELRGKVSDSVLVSAYELYCREMINLHFGQGFDIWWHNGHKIPSTDEYLQMCAYKTGTLARLSAKLSALFSGATPEQIEAIGKFAESIGVGFQIQDDILNLVGETLASTKGQYGEDIHEGKRTLMVLHCARTASPQDAKRLVEILDQHPTDQKIINEAIAIINKTGSIEYARVKAREIVKSAWNDVERVLRPSTGKQKLKAFADFLVERDI